MTRLAGCVGLLLACGDTRDAAVDSDVAVDPHDVDSHDAAVDSVGTDAEIIVGPTIAVALSDVHFEAIVDGGFEPFLRRVHHPLHQGREGAACRARWARIRRDDAGADRMELRDRRGRRRQRARAQGRGAWRGDPHRGLDRAAGYAGHAPVPLPRQ